MIEEMYKEEFGDESELLISKSSQEPNSTNQEDSTSQQQQQENNNNNNLTYSSADTTNIVFSSETKPDRVSGNDDEPQQQQQQMSRSADYDTLMNYHGFGVDDYRYISGSNQQESRFSNSHHLHDFVVWNDRSWHREDDSWSTRNVLLHFYS